MIIRSDFMNLKLDYALNLAKKKIKEGSPSGILEKGNFIKVLIKV